MSIDPELEEAISHDEIGLATARIGGAVVRSAFQPIFEARGDELHPVAVEGFARPYLEGVLVPPRTFLARLESSQLRSAERICAILHARNHSLIPVPELAHLVTFGDFALRDEQTVDGPFLAEALRGAPPGSAGRLRAFDLAHPELASLLAGALREQGAKFAMGCFSRGTNVWAEYRAARPEVIFFDGPWFRQIAGSRPALRLLALLVRRLHGDGVQILVRGIETRVQLASAIAIGCDLFQGFLMARPGLAGAVTEYPTYPIKLDTETEYHLRSLFKPCL